MTIARPLSPRRSADDRGMSRATAQKRLMIMMLLYGFAVGIVLTKLAFFAVFTGPAAAATIGGRASRGDIVDRNGAPLARTIDAWAIGVHPDELLGDKREIAQRLAGILGLDENTIYAQLTARKFAYIERDASASLVTEVNAIGEPALVFEREPQRLYPQSELAAPVLGFLDMAGRTRARRAADRSDQERPGCRAVDRPARTIGARERTRPASRCAQGEGRGGRGARRQDRRDHGAGVVPDV